MNTEHRPPCVDGNVCGESAHCPPAPDERTETVARALTAIFHGGPTPGHSAVDKSEDCWACCTAYAAVVAALGDEVGADRHVPASEQRLVLPQPPAEWLRDMSALVPGEGTDRG